LIYKRICIILSKTSINNQPYTIDYSISKISYINYLLVYLLINTTLNSLYIITNMSKSDKKRIFPKEVSVKQASDSGMALVLIFLILGLFTNNIIFYKIAIPVLVVNMITPMFYYYFAIFWFGITGLLGMFVSTILLTLIYVIMVVPVSLVRKIAGKDTLGLREFKKETNSVMKVRNYKFSPSDFEKPF